MRCLRPTLTIIYNFLSCYVSICSIGRGRQEGAIISLVIAAYLAFQHFSRIGTLQKSFDRGSIVATLAIISITAVSGLLLFWVYCKIIKSYQPYLPYELIWRGWKPENSHDLRTFHSHVRYMYEGLGKLGRYNKINISSQYLFMFCQYKEILSTSVIFPLIYSWIIRMYM